MSVKKGKSDEEEIVTNFDDLEDQSDEFKFLEGEIVDVKVEKSNENMPDKLYINVGLEVDFREEPWEISIPYSKQKESVWGRFLTALKENCGITIESPKDLKGLKLKFERGPIILESGFEAKKDFPLPIEDIS